MEPVRFAVRPPGEGYQPAAITTDHALSSYGQPVLVLDDGRVLAGGELTGWVLAWGTAFAADYLGRTELTSAMIAGADEVAQQRAAACARMDTTRDAGVAALRLLRQSHAEREPVPLHTGEVYDGGPPLYWVEL